MISISFLSLTRLSTSAPVESTCTVSLCIEEHAFTYSSQPHYLIMVLFRFQ